MGRIGPAYGLDGTVVVDPETDAPEQRFSPGSVVFLAGGTRLTVVGFQATERSPLVRFEEVPDRTAAEGLRGERLFIPPDQRRVLGDDEFWPDELVEMRVELGDGTLIGTVTAVETGLSQDRLIVALTDGRQVIVPLVEALVPNIDVPQRRLCIDPPPGLVD